MTKNTAPRIRDGVLDPAEWDFKKVPSGELEACYLYEYGREFAKRNKTFQRAIATWGKSLKGRDFDQISDSSSRMREMFGAVARYFPELAPHYFPEVPWQKLKPKDLKNIMSRFGGAKGQWGHLPHDRFWIDTLRDLKPTGVGSLEQFQNFHMAASHKTLENTEYGFFAIDWNFPDPELKRSFDLWLAQQRKLRTKAGLRKAKNQPVSRGGFRDQLSWLGALRVRDFYPAARLTDYPDSKLKVPAPHSHQPDLSKNSAKAETLIKQLFSTREGDGKPTIEEVYASCPNDSGFRRTQRKEIRKGYRS
jgi:hypothetical protein